MKSWFGLGAGSPKPANDEAHAGELLAAAEGALNRLRLGQPSEQSFALLNEAQVGGSAVGVMAASPGMAT